MNEIFELNTYKLNYITDLQKFINGNILIKGFLTLEY